MVASLRKLGFSKVFDTNFAADLTIVEEANELIERIENKGTLPMITSCSPGWIKFIEHFFPSSLPHLSTCKSPQDVYKRQGELHRYLADTMYQLGKENKIYRQLIKEKLPATGKKIAIVGAGPAGITAAYYLIRLGHEVTIYEAMPEAGGILRYGIPQYRLSLIHI